MSNWEAATLNLKQVCPLSPKTAQGSILRDLFLGSRARNLLLASGLNLLPLHSLHNHFHLHSGTLLHQLQALMACTLIQVQYGALDALVCGHIFRGLRLWHASPSACPVCRISLGATQSSEVRVQGLGMRDNQRQK